MHDDIGSVMSTWRWWCLGWLLLRDT